MAARVLFGALRAMMAATLAIATVTLSSSCVSILDLEDFLGASETFCDHLTRCFGEAAYPNCVAHVSSGLEGANPEARGAWLAALTDDECLAKCSNGLGCLDQTPVCNPPGDGCGQLEHCCGFQAGTQSCGEAGNCCLPDGVVCDETTVCCSACDPVTDTCGGANPCVVAGEGCEDDNDCCSDNCLPDGTCGLLCRERGTDCEEDADCCTDVCEGNICGCRADGAPCTSTEQCCSADAVCSDEGICDTDAACTPTGDPGCDGDDDCCGAGDGIECRTGSAQHGSTPTCCGPNGASAEGEDCCSGDSEGGTCCSELQGPCAPNAVNGENGCCADRACVDIPDKGPQCCIPPECGNPCGVQSAPLRLGGNCTTTPGFTQSCITSVCEKIPSCCCIAWTAACIAALDDGCACPASG